MNGARELPRVLIIADESANWKIAGLHQLDRLLLLLNEHAERTAAGDGMLPVTIAWRDDVERASWTPPDSEKLRTISIRKVPADGAGEDVAFDTFLSTRLLVRRTAIGELMASGQLHCDGVLTSAGRVAEHVAALPCDYVASRDQIPQLERKFLRDNGKTQDGLVSQYLNRPISRTITRQLLKFPIAPTAWTLLILPLPIIGSFFCFRGGYIDIVFGTILFQLYSVLDGCDGEIARAKFLESNTGRRIDTLCDTAATVLLVLGLGFGRSTAFSQTEAIIVASLIIVNEWALVMAKGDRSDADREFPPALYARHLHLWRHSGIQVFGERFVMFLVQLTKRDVAMLAFVVLALAGWSASILNLLGGAAAISLILSVNSVMRRPSL